MPRHLNNPQGFKTADEAIDRYKEIEGAIHELQDEQYDIEQYLTRKLALYPPGTVLEYAWFDQTKRILIENVEPWQLGKVTRYSYHELYPDGTRGPGYLATTLPENATIIEQGRWPD
jgi:hypothetical protein